MINPIILSFFGSVLGGVVTVHRTTSEPVVTRTRTISSGDNVIVSATTTTQVTLYQAVTTPLTVASGTVITTIGTSKPAPVTQVSSYSHTSFSNTVDPSTYTTDVSLTSTHLSSTSSASESSSTSSSTSSKETSSSSSSSNSVTTSPGASSSSVNTSSSSGSSDSTSATSSSSSSGSSSSTSSSSSTTSGSVTTSPEASSSSSSSSVTTSSSSSSASASSTASSSSSSSSDTNYYDTISDLFTPIDTSEPLSMFTRQGNGLSVPDNVKVSGPIETNKFYANLMLGTQTLTVFAQPYELFWSKDSDYYGMGVSALESSQRVFASGSPPEYYTNPLMLMSWVFSSTQFSSSNMVMDVTQADALSTTVELSTSGTSGQITIPISIGMGLATAVYSGDLTVRLFSQLGVNTLTKDTSPLSNIQKYQATLFNGKIWNVYVTTTDSDFSLTVNNDYEIVGSKAVDGLVVQLGYLPGDATDDSAIDAAAGAYPVSTELIGSVASDVATYGIKYINNGTSSSGSSLIYALPHHVDAFTDATSAAAVALTAYSPTKGNLTGVLSNKLEMAETLYTDLQWLPYQVDNSNTASYSSEALQLIASVLNDEISEDMVGQTDSTSTYTAGKSFDKFAYILLVASEILQDEDTTKQGLASLQTALAPWLNNTQPTPFIYDTNWMGVTSSAGETDDFGAPWYNDHHFHYGYYLHTAAVIGKIDTKYGGTWVEDNKDWVNSLVRDAANPSTEDSYFPVSRMFDFYNGHSWAAGLWESGDGKNEESTSEDYNFAYGMKLWGQTVGDTEMEARGDLMLSIMKRSMDKYFYYTDSNEVEPSDYLANRVAGISYENKLDHTTFFGTNTEYIQGIHMIPITGASGLIRSKNFVKQEWDSKLESIVGDLTSGWAGILRSNQALIDPATAYDWFAQDDFDSAYLDGGASRTWYLAFAAALSS